MNNILISNPFLFRPDSPVSSQEEVLQKKDEYFTDFNITFQKSQFDEAWENSDFNTEGLPSSSTPESNSFWSVSSPTISSTSESSNLEEVFPMDGYADFSFIGDLNEPISPGLNPSIDNDLNFNTNSRDPLDFDELDYWDICDGFDKDGLDKMANKKEQNDKLPPVSMEFANNGLSDQLVNSMSINMSSILPAPVIAQGVENVTTVAIMTAPPMNISTRGMHKRKDSLEHRMVAPSPQYSAAEETHTIDLKPDIQALGINNGQQRVGTKRRASSTSTSAGTSTSNNSSNKQKKPRKYELDVANDPSVRNAKAAKMNRDRKKRENQEMKTEIASLKKKLSSFENDLAHEREERAKYQGLYLQEKQKNVMSNGIQKNFTNMKKVLESVIPGLNQQFGPMDVEIPAAFANIPGRVTDDGSVETLVGEDGSFNILDERFQMLPESDDTSSYTTFHVSPAERKIRIDYNPHLDFH